LHHKDSSEKFGSVITKKSSLFVKNIVVMNDKLKTSFLHKVTRKVDLYKRNLTCACPYDLVVKVAWQPARRRHVDHAVVVALVLALFAPHACPSGKKKTETNFITPNVLK
jgi:hypothetical protein